MEAVAPADVSVPVSDLYNRASTAVGRPVAHSRVAVADPGHPRVCRRMACLPRAGRRSVDYTADFHRPVVVDDYPRPHRKAVPEAACLAAVAPADLRPVVDRCRACQFLVDRYRVGRFLACRYPVRHHVAGHYRVLLRPDPVFRPAAAPAVAGGGPGHHGLDHPAEAHKNAARGRSTDAGVDHSTGAAADETPVAAREDYSLAEPWADGHRSPRTGPVLPRIYPRSGYGALRPLSTPATSPVPGR